MEYPDNIKGKELSEESLEVLQTTPSWLIRWGLGSILFFLLTILGVSYFIKYPDIVPARIVLTTSPPPIDVVTKSSGRIKLLVTNNDEVKENQVLAVIENPAKYTDVGELQGQFTKIKSSIYARGPVIDKIRNLELNDDLSLGEIQNFYLAFVQSLNNYRQFKDISIKEKQILGLNSQINHHQKLIVQYEKQLQLFKEELKFSHKKLSRDSILFKQNVISEQDFNTSQSVFFQAKRTFEVLNINITTTMLRIEELRGKINEIQADIENNSVDFLEDIRKTFRLLENEVNSWQHRYLIISPFKGNISFFKSLVNDQFVNSGEQILAIIPDTNAYIGHLQLQMRGSGKVTIGQKVIVKFDNYPSEEFGSINGVVASISTLPKENTYLIEVEFPDGLITSYKNNLLFKQKMEGNAQIVTNDLRLIHRFFHQLRALTARK